MSTGRLKEIIKRKKNSQFNVHLDQYLRTTRIGGAVIGVNNDKTQA